LCEWWGCITHHSSLLLNIHHCMDVYSKQGNLVPSACRRQFLPASRYKVLILCNAWQAFQRSLPKPCAPGAALAILYCCAVWMALSNVTWVAAVINLPFNHLPPITSRISESSIRVELSAQWIASFPSNPRSCACSLVITFDSVIYPRY